MRETVLSPVAPQGFPGQTNLIDFGFDGFPDPLRAAPGLELLKSATFFIDAANAKTGDAYAFNQGTGGFALDARYGSSLAIGAADTNDPLLLPWTGENYVYLPGVAGNYANAPHNDAYNITGDIELVARVALDSWFPSTANVLIASVQSDPNRRFRWTVQPTSGQTFLELWPTGSAASAVSRGSALSAPIAGATYWLKATLSASTGQVRFYQAPDSTSEPSSWVELATPTAIGVTSIASVTAPMEVGGAFSGTSNNGAGKFYRAIVRDGIGGTTVFDANFTTGITSGAQTTFTESSSNAATVTINRSTAGRKCVAVTRPVWLFGTDDYMVVPDNALLNMDASQSFTVLVVSRMWTAFTFQVLASKKDDNSVIAGYALRQSSISRAEMLIADGTTGISNAVGVTTTSGALSTVAAIRDVGADNQTTYSNATASTPTADTTNGILTNTTPFRVGRYGVSGLNADMELLAVAVFRRALTATEIASINTYYGTA